MLPVSSRTTGIEEALVDKDSYLKREAKCYHAIRNRRLAQLMLPVSSRTAGIKKAVVDQDEQAERSDEDGVEDGRDLGQEGGGGQVQQAAAVHAHQQQGFRPQHNQVGPTVQTKQNVNHSIVRVAQNRRANMMECKLEADVATLCVLCGHQKPGYVSGS
jgi:hypothetical protein